MRRKCRNCRNCRKCPKCPKCQKVEEVKEELKKWRSKVAMNGLRNVENKKIRTFKSNRKIEIKNFVYSTPVQMNVILSNYKGDEKPFSLISDGFNSLMNRNVSFYPPSELESDQVSYYTYQAVHALVFHQLHIFGGSYNKYKVIKVIIYLFQIVFI